MRRILVSLLLTLGQFAGANDVVFVVSPNPRYSEEVKTLQMRLLELGYSEVGIADGYYGKKTEKAFSRFKYRNCLPRDGVYDEQTKTMLFSKDVKHGTGPQGPRPTLLALNNDLFGGWSTDGGWISTAKLIGYFDEPSSYEGRWFNSQFDGKATFRINSDQTGGPAFHSMKLIDTTFFPIANPDGPVWITTGGTNVLSEPKVVNPTSQETRFAKDSTRTWLSSNHILAEPTRFSVSAYNSPEGTRNLVVTAERLEGNEVRVKKAQTFYVCLLLVLMNGKSTTYPICSDIYLTDDDNCHDSEHRLFSINDLNGDGDAEFLVDWEYYEGSGTSIYSKINDTYEPVLSIGSGA